MKVLDLARKHEAKVIYAASSSFYGGVYKSPYGFSKWVGEEICKMYSKVYSIPTCIASFFNVYGPRQQEGGEYATIIGIYEKFMKNGENLIIYSDGNQRRDFTHVDDICSGLLAISKFDGRGEKFNLGTGKNYSINEVADMFGGNKEYKPERRGETRETLADIKMTSDLTGWKPTKNLKDYIDNFKKSLKHS